MFYVFHFKYRASRGADKYILYPEPLKTHRHHGNRSPWYSIQVVAGNPTRQPLPSGAGRLLSAGAGPRQSIWADRG